MDLWEKMRDPTEKSVKITDDGWFGEATIITWNFSMHMHCQHSCRISEALSAARTCS